MRRVRGSWAAPARTVWPRAERPEDGRDRDWLTRPASRCPEGGFRLPQKAGLSTLSLVIAAPGILMFGPQASLVTDALQAEHVVFAGLDLLLADDLVHEHGDGRSLRVERLLDLDVAASPCGSGRGRPARRSSSSS